MTERAFQRQVLTKLRKLGGLWENRSPSVWSPEGIADITGCYQGRFVAIELKQPGKYKDPHEGLTPAQVRYLARVREAGGIAVCADTWGGVADALGVAAGPSKMVS